MGSAMIIPSMPINDPQMESDNKMMAGFSPVIFPMMRGTKKPSCMSCTTANTASAMVYDHPKVFSRLSSFQHGKGYGGYEPDNLKIRN